MENSLASRDFPNFGKNLSFVMDHDSGYMSSESNAKPEEEKFVISEIIPNVENSENAVDGKSDVKNWEVVATSFMNIVKKDNSLIKVDKSELLQPHNVSSNLSLTPQKYENPINPNVSPDLFPDEEFTQGALIETVEASTSSKHGLEKKYVRKDYLLVRKATNSLKGVIPPHCMTVVQLSVDEMLNKIEANKEYFWSLESVLQSKCKVLNTCNDGNEDGFKSLLLTGSKDIVNQEWPGIMQRRFHGLQ